MQTIRQCSRPPETDQMNNLIYFFYFLYAAKYKHVFASLSTFPTIWLQFRKVVDMCFCSIKYGSSLIDYFNFRFFEKSAEERSKYATTAFMYQFHNRLNPKAERKWIDDKSNFAQAFSKFTTTSLTIEKNDLQGANRLLQWLKDNNLKKVVIKDPLGTTGSAVSFASWNAENGQFLYKSSSYDIQNFIGLFNNYDKILFEFFIQQHDILQNISPTALNTIRILTVVDLGVVNVIGAVFRISVDCEVDNFSAGNLAAEIDIKTGQVLSPGTYKLAATKPQCDYHPSTGAAIKGVFIPHWQLVLAKAQEAALVYPNLKTVGWDIAVMQDDVMIIEGNTCWNKDTWQIPAGYGKKQIIEKYIK